MSSTTNSTFVTLNDGDWRELRAADDQAVEAGQSGADHQWSLSGAAVNTTGVQLAGLDRLVLDDADIWQAGFSIDDGALIIRFEDGSSLTLEGFVEAAASDLVIILPDGNSVLAQDFVTTLASANTQVEPGAGSSESHGGGADFAAYSAGTGLDGLDDTGPLGTPLFGPTGVLDDFSGTGNSGLVALNGGLSQSNVNSQPFSPPNQAPVANDDAATTTESAGLTMNPLDNDLDPDRGGSIRLSSVDASNIRGSVSINPDGTLSYDPNGQFEHLGVGDEAQETIIYTIIDDKGATSQGSVTITVRGENDAPVAVTDYGTIDEDTSFTFHKSALRWDDTDADGDALKILSVQNAKHGTVTMAKDGKVTFTPDKDYHGQTTFEYTVSDGNGGTATGQVKMTVNPVNDAPEAKSLSINVTENDDMISIDLNDLVSDPDLHDSLSIIGVDQTGGTKAIFKVVDGKLTLDPDQFDHFFDGDAANIELTYAVRDSSGAGNDTATGVIDISIAGITDLHSPTATP